jgi:type III restriction enzyme
MPDVVIHYPVINSPFTEPLRHFEFGDRGITGVIREGRRQWGYFVPIRHASMSGALAHRASARAGNRMQRSWVAR